MPSRERQTFPLVPRRRLVGLPFGDLPSRRRGVGSDVIGTRPYEPGDPVSTIDWFSSARLSTARGRDEFVVRSRASDEAPRVALLLDRRPAMGLYPEGFPWLSKRRALGEAVEAIVASAAAARADVAALDLAGGEPYWLPPGRRERPALVVDRAEDAALFDAPEHGLQLGLEFLVRLRSDLPQGSFLFVLSDFLVPPPTESWLDALAHAWDIVPVVIQDPVWEQSFPAAAGVALPLADPRSGRVALVRLGSRQVARRRVLNEERLRSLVAEFETVGMSPVVLGTSDPFDIDRAFLEWAEERRRSRWDR
jgi:uncharacterized protein (DUF58 family)